MTRMSIRSLDAHCLDATKSSCGRSLLGSRHFVIWLHPLRTPPSRHKEARCLEAANSFFGGTLIALKAQRIHYLVAPFLDWKLPTRSLVSLCLDWKSSIRPLEAPCLCPFCGGLGVACESSALLHCMHVHTWCARFDAVSVRR